MGIFRPKQCHLRAVQVLLHFHLFTEYNFSCPRSICTIQRPGAIGRRSPDNTKHQSSRAILIWGRRMQQIQRPCLCHPNPCHVTRVPILWELSFTMH